MDRTTGLTTRLRTGAALAASVLALAACGADGEPEPPQVQTSMNAHIGLGSSGNVNGGASLGLRRGPVSLSLGF